MKGLVRSLGRGDPQVVPIIKKTIPLAGAIVSSGASGIGFGTAICAGLPEGNLLILGAVAYVQFSKDTVLGATGTLDAFTGSYAIGSAANADTDLTDAGDADIVAAKTLAAATAGVSPLTRGPGNTALAYVDNTDSSKSLHMNLLLDDASVSADTQHINFTGELYIAYIVLGDD